MNNQKEFIINKGNKKSKKNSLININYNKLLNIIKIHNSKRI